MIIIQKLFDQEIRSWTKYYGNQIRDNLEWIEGLDKHNIDNAELEHHYSMIMDYVYSLHAKLENYSNEIKDDDYGD